jgi:hypothetical protein
MTTHTNALHCPYSHQDGDVMCVHTASSDFPVILNTKSMAVYDTMREKFPGFRDRTNELTERLNAIASAPRVERTSPRKELRKPVTSPRKEVKKDLISPRKELKEDLSSAKKAPARKRKYSRHELETESFEGDDDAYDENEDDNLSPGVTDSGCHRSKKSRHGYRGNKTSDRNYVYKHLPDIAIPENEVVPDSLTSPEKIEALYLAAKKAAAAATKASPLPSSPAKARAKSVVNTPRKLSSKSSPVKLPPKSAKKKQTEIAEEVSDDFVEEPVTEKKKKATKSTVRAVTKTAAAERTTRITRSSATPAPKDSSPVKPKTAAPAKRGGGRV